MYVFAVLTHIMLFLKILLSNKSRKFHYFLVGHILVDTGQNISNGNRNGNRNGIAFVVIHVQLQYILVKTTIFQSTFLYWSYKDYFKEFYCCVGPKTRKFTPTTKQTVKFLVKSVSERPWPSWHLNRPLYKYFQSNISWNLQKPCCLRRNSYLWRHMWSGFSRSPFSITFQIRHPLLHSTCLMVG